MRSLLDYLPEHVKEIEEIRAIILSEQVEFDSLFEERMRFLNNQFLEKADEFGISRLENIYETTENRGLSLDERRFALRTLMLERRPTTYNFLESRLKVLCGENGYTLKKDYQNQNLIIKLALDKKSKISSTDKLIRSIIPANITYDLDLLYNTHQMLIGTYSSLNEKTHIEIKAEVL